MGLDASRLTLDGELLIFEFVLRSEARGHLFLVTIVERIGEGTALTEESNGLCRT